jgi:FSR family fosmidomycin resistance protein-like MFS transporter
MLKRLLNWPVPGRNKPLWGAVTLTTLFISIEFFDELYYGVEGVTLPALRANLGLSYAQVGLLLGLPGLVSALIEPAIMLLGDTRLRKSLILSGGCAVAAAAFLTGASASFTVLLAAFAIGYPASGAFVTLSQASLMDAHPGREQQMMARWSLAGSLANLAAPLLMAAGFWLGFGWRWVYFVLAALALLLTFQVRFQTFSRLAPGGDPHLVRVRGFGQELRTLLRGAGVLARNRNYWRWTLLLQLSDLMLDILTTYLPLYLTDLAGLDNARTGLVIGLVMFATLAADAALIPLLERFPGRSVVRISAALTGLLYAVWLLLPWSPVKLVLLLALRLGTLGWYPVLQGEAYATAPGKSGSVLALGTITGVLGSGMAWLVGWVAGEAGLPTAMWLLLLGPVSLALFVPRAGKVRPG